MVINDHDTVDSFGCAVFGDVGKITGVGLPDLSEFVLFKGFAVTKIGISGRFQVVVPYETLDGINTDGGRDKGFPYQMSVNLGGIHARVFFLDTVDFSDGILV